VLQRYIAWIAVFCNPTYCGQKYRLEKIISLTGAIAIPSKKQDLISSSRLPPHSCRRIHLIGSLAFVFLMLGLLAGTAEAATETFSTSGTTSWTAPSGVTSVTVEAWGGGGAGGGVTGNPAKGGGGAGGQYARKVVAVTPGNSYAITVGAGGTVSTGNGTAGDDSTFNGTDVVAKGGAAGGGAASNGGDGTAGMGSSSGGIGDVINAGGSGAAGSASSGSGNCNNGGSGGGGAGSGGAGGNASGNTGGVGTATGGGSGGGASNSSGNGSPGSTAGGAGSGACAESGTDRNGGAGAAGRIDITYTISAVTSINCVGACTTAAAGVSWDVTFNTSVTGVSTGNFTLVNSGLSGTPAITGVTGSGTTWTVTASTGTGTGTLGLNMANVTGISPSVTPTTFTGQVYTIDRTAPVVSSIALVDPTPTGSSSVSWAVTFSKSVTGVNTADFALVQAGGVSGAAITSVTGSGTAWIVAANTGTGNGTLGLDLADDDSIVDAASNPLGGTGNSNGDFSGEIYSIVRPASPTVCVDDASIGTKAWSTLTGPVSSDNAYATASVSDGETTHYLKCTGYGFAIPSDAIIEGITVGVERFAGSTNLQDAAMKIVKGGVIGATDKSNTGTYPNSDPNTYDNHGGATDLWGETWTAADINSSNFGVALASRKSDTAGGGRTISVDHMTISVAYRRPSVNCTSNASSNWTLSTTWTNCRGGIPLAGDQVTILGAHTVTLNTTTPVLGDLTNGGTLNASGTNTLSIGGNFVNNGTVSLGSSNVDLYGNFSNTTGASFNLGTTDSGTWTFRGTALQNIDSTDIFTVFPNLAINNTTGIALNASATVKTLLTLTDGYISTSNNTLALSANCTDVTSTNGTSWVRTSGFVNGNLRLKFPTGTTTCTFPVGSVTYAPISVALTASAAGTTLTGSSIGSEHPQIATAGIDATKDVNRYWSLWATGDTATAVTSFGATFTFVSGDIDIGATTSNFIVGKYDGSAWTLPTVGTRTSTSISITGVSGPVTANIGFAVGEVGVVDAPCTSPAGMTCVCDNFGRTYINPSTIFGANWVVGHSSGTFGDPSIVSNSLRLTDASTNVSTVATLPGQFPAAGNTITVEFQHYAYGSTVNSTASPCTALNPCGADGIALILSDSSVTPVAGAYGGSLGYAQKTNINGFAGGWLGVGLDEWGNFANPTEGRVGGSGFAPESVTLRGSGSGTSNYPYLVTTGSLGVSEIDHALSSSRSWGYLYRITVDASAYTWNSNTSTGVKTTKVKVERDATGTGNNYVTLPNLNLPDIYTYNTGQADVPTNWKLSFTGASGSDTNIHEIRGLKICSNSYTPPSGFSILVDNLSPTTCATNSNGKPVITVSAHDSSGNVITNYTNTVTLGARVSSPSGSNSTTVAWSKVSGSANGTLSSGNQYTFAAADNGVAKFYLTDTNAEDIYISVSENGGTLSTTLSTPLQYRGTAFTVTTPDTLGTGVVAGRNHLMSITRSSGCGTDTTYSGAKNLDGWYSIATGTHPAGAYAPELCTTNVEGSCLPATGSCATLSIAPPALNAGSNYLPALTFTNGVANFCLMTTDVGNYSVNLRDDSNVSVPITGSSATLAVRPFAVVASNVKQGAINNPATSNATGTPMVAGSAFQAMVAGYLWNSTGDTFSNGLPGASADYTAITGGGIAHSYADTVVLSPRTPFAPATPFDAPAGTGTAGDLTNSSVALTGGSAILSTLSYNEVGSFTLRATPSVNYLNAGVDLSTRVAYFTNPDSFASTSWVGRFRPDHFTLTSGTPSPGCGTFTYFGQDGFSSTAFTLIAQNSNNITTQNYAGSYAKLALTTWANFGFTVTNPPVGSVLSESDTVPEGSWSNGVATVTAWHQLSRPTALTGETNVVVRAAPTDSDGVTMAASDVGPSTPLRYGRLTLQNAYGSELLALPMSLTAEYWNGTSWVTNVADSCTALTAPADGSGLALNLASTGTTTSTLSNPLDSGDAGFSLAAPGATHTGYVVVTIASPDWLDFKWDGVHDTDPTARATFGIYKGNSKFIYIRELY